MKKVICIIIFIVIIILLLCFTNRSKDITIDINMLTEDIIQNVNFEDELNKIDNETIAKLYNINNAVSQEVYMSSGATAEEIAIFEFKDRKECKEALEKVNKRIENQKESFKEYMPKEMKKLENAIIINKNKYIITCITNENEKMENILNKYIR